MKILLTTALLAFSVGTVSAGYEGLGGSVAASAASVSATQVGGTQFGGGVQASGAFSQNQTSAGASKTYTPNGVIVNAHTASAGLSATYVDGVGSGTSEAFTAQGGIAEANAAGGTGDYESHNYWYTSNPHRSKALGGGFVEVSSKSGQGTFAKSKNQDDGFNYQESQASAWNNTSGFVTVDTKAGHKRAKVELGSGITTEGGTYAGSYGVNDGAFGYTVAIAGQTGGGTAGAYGSIGNYKGKRYYHPHNNHYHTGYYTTDWSNGIATVNSEATVKSFSISGGINNHDSWTGTYTAAVNESFASIGSKFKNNGLKQKTSTSSESLVIGVSGGSASLFQPDGFGGSFSHLNAEADGDALAFGTFHGFTTVTSGSDPIAQGCVANGGTGNCGIGQGLGGGNGTGNEGNHFGQLPLAAP